MKWLSVILFAVTIFSVIFASIIGKLYCDEVERNSELECEIIKAKAEAEQARTLLEIRNDIERKKNEDGKNLKSGSVSQRFNAASDKLRNAEN